jgi:hypothetical protein
MLTIWLRHAANARPRHFESAVFRVYPLRDETYLNFSPVFDAGASFSLQRRLQPAVFARRVPTVNIRRILACSSTQRLLDADEISRFLSPFWRALH